MVPAAGLVVRQTGGLLAFTGGDGAIGTGLATGGATRSGGLLADTGAAGGTATMTPWLGTATGVRFMAGRTAVVENVDAGCGMPFPGLMPAACRISGRTSGALKTGALTMALSGIATRLA